MAVLRAQDPATSFIVPARCLIGRSRACDLVLPGHEVSSQHAVLQWAGARWDLQDLGSRNGTHVDGERLAPGTRLAVRSGATIRFGRASLWTLVDDAAPQLVAIDVNSGAARIGDGGYLALPDPQQPAACIYQDLTGAWVCERTGELASIADRTIISLGDALWRIHLPGGADGTWEDSEGTVRAATLRLRFTHSRDEEYVELVAFAGERRIDLQVRAHHYVLLILARRRLAHRERGLPEAEQGWIRQDDLLALLKMDENHLNISIHRARAQLGKLGVADAATLIERRPGTRQLRLGLDAIEVVPQGPG